MKIEFALKLNGYYMFNISEHKEFRGMFACSVYNVLVDGKVAGEAAIERQYGWLNDERREMVENDTEGDPCEVVMNDGYEELHDDVQEALEQRKADNYRWDLEMAHGLAKDLKRAENADNYDEAFERVFINRGCRWLSDSYLSAHSKVFLIGGYYIVY